MPLEKDGNKIIKEVKFLKNKVNIIFQDDSELKIYESTYAHFYLYKDKILTLEEIDMINSYNGYFESKDYALGLLLNGLYSEKEIRDKLKSKKKLSFEKIDQIIEDLKSSNYINDENYVEEYIDIYENRNYGKNKIINKLKEAGISNNLINNISFSSDGELEKAQTLVKKYCKTNKNKNYKALKEGSYRMLISQGFDYEISNKAVEIIDEIYDFDSEVDLLNKMITKYMITHRINLKEPKNREKVISYFVRKGFKYQEIEKNLRRIEEDEIC